MKRTGAILTALVLSASLTACGGSKDGQATNEPAVAETVEEFQNWERACLGNPARYATDDGYTIFVRDSATSEDIPAADYESYRIDKQTQIKDQITFEVTRDDTCAKPLSAPSANEPAPAEATKDRDTTDAGLDFGTASVACDRAGKTAFPYGWDAHWTLGLIGEEVTADSYFLKASVDVKNEFNAKAEMVVECTVTGDEYAPEVTAFDVY